MVNPDRSHHSYIISAGRYTGQRFLLRIICSGDPRYIKRFFSSRSTYFNPSDKYFKPGPVYFFINAFLLKMVSGVIPGFDVFGFWPAIFGSLLISLVSWLLNSFINEQGRVNYIDLKHKDGNRWK